MKKADDVYAVANFNMEGDYGHLNVYIYEALGYNGGVLKLSCQVGGRYEREKSYGWDFGLSTNSQSIVSFPKLANCCRVLRKITLQMDKRDEKYPVESENKDKFSHQVVRTIQAANIKKVYVNNRLNRGYSELADLLIFDTRRQMFELENTLHLMERELIAKAPGSSWTSREGA